MYAEMRPRTQPAVSRRARSGPADALTQRVMRSAARQSMVQLHRTIFVTIALLLGVPGCASARRPVLEACDQYLRATLRVEEGPAIIGEHYNVTFALLNTGSATIEACFGEAFEVTFVSGRRAQG